MRINLSRKTSNYAALTLRKSHNYEYINVFLRKLKHAFAAFILKKPFGRIPEKPLAQIPRSDALRNGFPTSKVPLEEENPFYIGSNVESSTLATNQND